MRAATSVDTPNVAFIAVGTAMQNSIVPFTCHDGGVDRSDSGAVVVVARCDFTAAGEHRVQDLVETRGSDAR